MTCRGPAPSRTPPGGNMERALIAVLRAGHSGSIALDREHRLQARRRMRICFCNRWRSDAFAAISVNARAPPPEQTSSGSARPCRLQPGPYADRRSRGPPRPIRGTIHLSESSEMFPYRKVQIGPIRILRHRLAPEILAPCRRALLGQRVLDKVDVQLEPIAIDRREVGKSEDGHFARPVLKSRQMAWDQEHSAPLPSRSGLSAESMWMPCTRPRPPAERTPGTGPRDAGGPKPALRWRVPVPPDG